MLGVAVMANDQPLLRLIKTVPWHQELLMSAGSVVVCAFMGVYYDHNAPPVLKYLIPAWKMDDHYELCHVKYKLPKDSYKYCNGECSVTCVRLCVCVCTRHSVNITCSGRDLSDFYTGAGFLPFANLSALPWKYFVNRVVIIAVILFHRNSSAGFLMNTYHTRTHIYAWTHTHTHT